MLSRREILAGGLVGGLTSDAVDGRVAEQSGDREMGREIKNSIDAIKGSVDRAFNTLTFSGTGPIGQLRKNFEQFVRSNSKFPDFCDIGMGVFYDVYDWHVRNRQQILVVRQPDNRYTIQFMFTTLMLRQENEVNFIGYPYDKA
jgi:hypothetical protein